MLSVVIETHNDEDALARTLASLVPAAVEGVVREVIVCDRGSTDRTRQVADYAGCAFIADGALPAGIRAARGEWLLLLQPGSRMAEGWMQPVVEHMAAGGGPARFTRSRVSRLPVWARLFSGRKPLVDGLVIEKSRALALANGDDDAAWLARKVSARRLSGQIHLPA